MQIYYVMMMMELQHTTDMEWSYISSNNTYKFRMHGSIGHISNAGALRLAKAMWWMLARMAGWDGGTIYYTCNRDNGYRSRRVIGHHNG